MKSLKTKGIKVTALRWNSWTLEAASSFSAEAAWGGGGEHEEKTTLHRALSPQQGRQGQGLIIPFFFFFSSKPVCISGPARLFVEAPKAGGKREEGGRKGGKEGKGETWKGKEEESKGSCGSWNWYIRLQKLKLCWLSFFRGTSSSHLFLCQVCCLLYKIPICNGQIYHHQIWSDIIKYFRHYQIF